MMSPADAEKFMKLPDEIRNLRSVVEALPEPSLRAEIAEAQALIFSSGSHGSRESSRGRWR